MVVRFRRKSPRLRGSKTHGWGAKKKHRGAGSRGGHGFSGMMKHKKSFRIRFDPNHLDSTKGFTVPSEVKSDVRAITLKSLDILAKKMNKVEIDVSELGFNKVLSTGKITQALTIKADKIVKNAKAKIEEAGGKAIENA